MKAQIVGRFTVPNDDNRDILELIERIKEKYLDSEIKLVLYPERDEENADSLERLIDAVIDVIDDMTSLEEELGVSQVELWQEEG